MTTTAPKTLEDVIQAQPNLASYLYNDTLSPHPRNRAGLTPVPLEFSSWMEEQRAWRNTAVLFDQSHHMPELFVKGPDAIRLLSYIGVNSFENFVPGRPKQFIGCNHEGRSIGESLMYCHDEEHFELVSGQPLLNWVEYNAKVGGYNVTLERDNHTAFNPTGTRVKFRFQVDGPNASKIFAEAIEGEVPEIKFFRTAKVVIDGCEVLVLRHGMAGHAGVELSGHYEDGPAVRAKLFAVGEKYGLKPGGTLAYFSSVSEGGWMGPPFPAIYTSDKLRDYRKSLPADTWEASAQIGGSLVSDNIEDYYLTPWDSGVNARIKFDHDFIGRSALEELSKNPKRARRSLVWDKRDVNRIFESLLEPGPAYKLLRFPFAGYGYYQNDAVRTPAGKLVGIGTFPAYSANEALMLSIATVDLDCADIGTELVLTWGEPNGGSRKPHVERHKQIEVRVKVAPAPYADTVNRVKHDVIA